MGGVCGIISYSAVYTYVVIDFHIWGVLYSASRGYVVCEGKREEREHHITQRLASAMYRISSETSGIYPKFEHVLDYWLPWGSITRGSDSRNSHFFVGGLVSQRFFTIPLHHMS